MHVRSVVSGRTLSLGPSLNESLLNKHKVVVTWVDAARVYS